MFKLYDLKKMERQVVVQQQRKRRSRKKSMHLLVSQNIFNMADEKILGCSNNIELIQAKKDNAEKKFGRILRIKTYYVSES